MTLNHAPLSQKEQAFLAQVAAAASASGLFGRVEVHARRVQCEALASAEPAFYRVDLVGDECFVSLVTPARYLSQSIEADLVHTGDKLDDLLADELVEAGYAGAPLRVEHFRDPEKMYTFRAKVPAGPSGPEASAVTAVLRAFESCFRPLGDMQAAAEED